MGILIGEYQRSAARQSEAAFPPQAEAVARRTSRFPRGVVWVAAVAALGIGALAPRPPVAAAASCPGFALGVDYFSAIETTGTTCAVAKRLLDKTTLTSNRRGRVSWSYGGWMWSLRRVNEMESVISGRQSSRRIAARWSKS